MRRKDDLSKPDSDLEKFKIDHPGKDVYNTQDIPQSSYETEQHCYNIEEQCTINEDNLKMGPLLLFPMTGFVLKKKFKSKMCLTDPGIKIVPLGTEFDHTIHSYMRFTIAVAKFFATSVVCTLRPFYFRSK